MQGTIYMMIVPGLFWSKKKTEFEEESDKEPQRNPLVFDVAQVGAYHTVHDEVCDTTYLLVNVSGFHYPVDLTYEEFKRRHEQAAWEWNQLVIGQNDNCDPVSYA